MKRIIYKEFEEKYNSVNVMKGDNPPYFCEAKDKCRRRAEFLLSQLGKTQVLLYEWKDTGTIEWSPPGHPKKDVGHGTVTLELEFLIEVT